MYVAEGKRVEHDALTRSALLASAMSDSSGSGETRMCRATCGMRRPLTDFHFNGRASRTGKRYQQSQCRECERDAHRILRRIRRAEGPPPSFCENCMEEPPTCCDHDHRTGTFRGWLCSTCNRGLGMLGDDIPGLLRALAYLERAQARSSASNSGPSGEERVRSRSPRHHGDVGGAPASPESR